MNSIDEDEDDREWIIEDDDEKINKRLIPYDYTFYKIYKDGCESYIGSTVNYNNRKSKHKYACNNPKSNRYNLPLYQYIRENGGYDTFNYEILDKKFVCKKDAEIYEGELMKIHNSTLNVCKNYSEEDKKTYQKKYHEKYPDKKIKCEFCNCFITRERNMKIHILSKKHIQNLENRITQLEEKQDINNITINIQNLTINQLPQD